MKPDSEMFSKIIAIVVFNVTVRYKTIFSVKKIVNNYSVYCMHAYIIICYCNSLHGRGTKAEVFSRCLKAADLLYTYNTDTIFQPSGYSFISIMQFQFAVY
jgi:hypothetical protein